MLGDQAADALFGLVAHVDVSHRGQHAPRCATSFRRAALKRSVDKGLPGREVAERIPASEAGWLHSGFEVSGEVAVAEVDRAGQLRLARTCARNPVALERLDYEGGSGTVTYRSDKATGPTAGTYRFDPLVPRLREPRYSSRPLGSRAAAGLSGGRLSRPRPRPPPDPLQRR